MRKLARWMRIAWGLALALVVVAPPMASAGTYTVYGTCGLWRPYTNGVEWVSPSATCPQLKVYHPVAGYSSPAGGEGGWVFDAPPGTAIHSFYIEGNLLGTNGWQAAVIPTSGSPVENCSGSNCPGAYKYLFGTTTYPGSGSAAVVLRMRCGAAGGCPNSSIFGYINVFEASVSLIDGAPPGVQITGGPLASEGWQSGTAAVSYDAGDNAGIKLVRASLDGRPRAEALRGCDYTSKAPCPNGGGSLSVDTTGLPDGAHTLVVQAVDAGDNVAQASRVVYTDNSAPSAPRELAVSGSGAWQATDSFRLKWENPQQSASQIAAAEYTLCPAQNAASDGTGCVTGSSRTTNINEIRELRVPKPGSWRLSLYLRDAAGNADRSAAASASELRYDPTPPVVSFLPATPDDPTRVRVAATDATSGLATRSLEIRREGTAAWLPVPVTPDAQGFSATLDDGELADGLYHLRARVTDAAGNERSAETRPDGQAAVLALPVRLKTRLAVGRVKKVRAKSSRGHKPRYRRVLVSRPRSRYGRTVTLHGRLTTPGANPVVDTDVEVSELIDLPARRGPMSRRCGPRGLDASPSRLCVGRAASSGSATRAPRRCDRARRSSTFESRRRRACASIAITCSTARTSRSVAGSRVDRSRPAASSSSCRSTAVVGGGHSAPRVRTKPRDSGRIAIASRRSRAA
jgi:hypothetical protein